MATRGVVMGICWMASFLCASMAVGDAQPTTLQELEGFYPKVVDGMNAALVYQSAVEARVMDMSSYQLPLLGDGKMPCIEEKSLDPKVKEGIVAELRRNARALQLLHQAGTMPQCRFPIDLTKGAATELPHLAPMRDLARLLALQAINAADDKNPELAAQSILDMIAIPQSLRKEPVIISQLVRIAIWGIVFDALEQAVNRVPFRDKYLLSFQESLAKADDREALTRAFQGELCWLMNVETETAEERASRIEAMKEYQEKMRAEHMEAESRSDPADAAAVESNTEEIVEESVEGQSAEQAEHGENSEPIPAWPEMQFPPKLSPKEKQEMVEEARHNLEESRLPYVEFMKLVPQPFDPKTMTYDEYVKQKDEGNQHLPALRRTVVAAARMAAKAAAARGALAVERYRLKFGKLPEKWEDMVPDLLDAPIPDPFVKDAPLVLQVSETSCVVYSLGQNGKDDGGTERDGHLSLDHVFRIEYPVSSGK